MNPVAIKLGSISIYWYAIFIVIGVLIAGKIILSETKKHNIDEDFMLNLFIGLFIFALLGARLYYIVFNLDYYLTNPNEIFNIAGGGLAIHGGIILGAAWIIYYSNKKQQPIIKLFDIMSIGLIIGQAFGRWGNFFNQEAFGPITTLNFLQKIKLPNFIIEGMYISGNYHHPTFLYESFWCLIGFIIMFILIKKLSHKIKEGNILSFYLIWYGIGRFVIESLRTDSLMLKNIKIAQLVSILMILIGIIIIATSKKRKYLSEKSVKKTIDNK